jgi:hypothetical protein
LECQSGSSCQRCGDAGFVHGINIRQASARWLGLSVLVLVGGFVGLVLSLGFCTG